MGIITVNSIVLICIAALIFSVPAHAEKSGNHGQSHAQGKKQEKAHKRQFRHYGGDTKGHKKAQADKRQTGHFGGSVAANVRFDDRHRRLIQDYFDKKVPGENCPPGLAKKGTACLPPGQARKWQLNQPLPRGLERYPLPPDLLSRLSSAPNGYEYVRYDSDILMITTGSNMVVDAIRGLVR